MEGTGFLQGTWISEIPTLIVRGISDLCVDKERSDMQGSQSIAAAHASAFALSVIDGFLTQATVSTAA
jgi:nucleoside phosphorylase